MSGWVVTFAFCVALNIGLALLGTPLWPLNVAAAVFSALMVAVSARGL